MKLRLMPKSLAGRMIGLMLVALALAQVASFVILSDERRLAILEVRREQVLSTVATVILTLQDTPEHLHDHILANASSPRMRFYIAPVPDPATEIEDITATHHLRDQMEKMLADTGLGPVLVGLTEFASLPPPPELRRRGMGQGMGQGGMGQGMMGQGNMGPQGPVEERHRYDYEAARTPLGLAIAVGLGPDRWLNVRAVLFAPKINWAVPSLITMALAAIAVIAVVVLTVGRITKPLRALARASDTLGRGGDIDPVPESGPADIAHAARAFNQMHDRLERYLKDRTTMLAAIAHDLRTPVTTLRLKAEFIEDEAVKADLLKTLDEMQHLAEATLAFAREEAHVEPARAVRLDALIDSLADDLADAGHAVAADDLPAVTLTCRPKSLGRALRNLMENAVRYGETARVSIEEDPRTVAIHVDDDGPGIPEADRARVFEPFARLETSRSMDTGGVGLGLAIVRSIARAHGGDVILDAAPSGGLRATITLPVDAT